jgi:hypothetical protein
MIGGASLWAVGGVVARRTPGHLPWPPLLFSSAAAGAAIGIPAVRGQGVVAAAQVAGLALAAAAGYLLDDPAAAVTQTVPRPLWRRRSATVVRGLAVLAATWIVLLTLLRRAAGFSAVPLTIETTVTALLSLAAAALLAQRGEPEPGNLTAPAVILTGVGAMLLQPLLGVTLFLSADEESASRLLGWAGVAILAVLILLAAWRDPARRRRGRSRTLWTTRAPAPGDPVADAHSPQRRNGSRGAAPASHSASGRPTR